MKALISPNDFTPKYISSWNIETIDGEISYIPVYSEISNAQRVAEVANAEFEIASPLFWVDCGNDVVADECYYDTSDSTIKLIADLNVAKPTEQ